MRRIRHHHDDDIGLFRNFLAGFADDATRGNELLRNGPDVVKKQAMPGSLEVTCHRTSHDSQPNEANVTHLDLPYPRPTMRRLFVSCTIRGLQQWWPSACIRSQSSRDIRSGRDGETG